MNLTGEEKLKVLELSKLCFLNMNLEVWDVNERKLGRRQLLIRVPTVAGGSSKRKGELKISLLLFPMLI